jgi:hypothetical protein
MKPAEMDSLVETLAERMAVPDTKLGLLVRDHRALDTITLQVLALPGLSYYRSRQELVWPNGSSVKVFLVTAARGDLGKTLPFSDIDAALLLAETMPVVFYLDRIVPIVWPELV